jgi:hypothetical protein
LGLHWTGFESVTSANWATGAQKIIAQETSATASLARAVLNKYRHYSLRKMIYHYGVDFSQIMNIILAIFAFGTLITAILTFRQTKEFEK